MATLAELIRDEVKKDDVLKDIKEDLIRSITAQIKKKGKARIMWGYSSDSYHNKQEFTDDIIVLLDHTKIEYPLMMWLDEQGLQWKKEYYLHTGGEWGLSITVPLSISRVY